MAPEAYSEHPNWEPDFGAWYVSQIIDTLASHPEVWSKMALFLTYDEEGGHFDHLVPPTPAVTLAQGKSNVPVTNEYFNGSASYPTTDYPAGPYGLGIRVPMVVVSPWSRGGWVNSQVFDHTSVLQFLEARFGVREPNIGAFRRAVCGDLLSAFNFANPNDEARLTLAGRKTQAEADALRAQQEQLAPIQPAPDTGLPRQATGTRPSRALPYELHASALADARNVQAIDDPHARGLLRQLRADIALRPVPRLFAPVERPCISFSQWWHRTRIDA